MSLDEKLEYLLQQDLTFLFAFERRHLSSCKRTLEAGHDLPPSDEVWIERLYAEANANA